MKEFNKKGLQEVGGGFAFLVLVAEGMIGWAIYETGVGLYEGFTDDV